MEDISYISGRKLFTSVVLVRHAKSNVASSQKQQLAGRTYYADSEPTNRHSIRLLGGEAATTNYTASGVSRPGIESTTSCT